MANESLVGRQTETGAAGLLGKIDVSGFKALRSELQMAEKALGGGLLFGVQELAFGGSKVKAVWESIKWTALTRAGLGGLALLTGAFFGLTGAIRKGIRESGILQSALEKVGTTKMLTNQFTQFLGNVDAARRRVGELYQFVANSKFNLGEVANASKVLTILSNGSLGGQHSLEMLGAISKSTDTDLQELSVTVAQLNSQIRRGENISGSVQSLKDMGVLSESTADHINNLSKSGASSSTIWGAVSTELDNAAAAAKNASPSMEVLEDRATKARNAMAAKFGEPFLAAERESLQHSIELTEALTPAVQKLGQMLAAVTAPAESLKSRFADIYKTDWFRDTLTRLTEIAVVLPGIVGAYQVIKGVSRFAGSTKKVFMGGGDAVSLGEGFANLWNARPSINPRKALERGSGRLLEISERLSATSPQLAKGVEIAGKGMNELARGAGVAGTMIGRLGGFFVRFLGPIGAFIGVTYLLTKAWDAYSDSVERAQHTDELTREMGRQNNIMDEQIKKMKTLDDHTRLLTDARRALSDAYNEQLAVAADPNSTDEEKNAANAAVSNARRNLRKAQQVDTSNLAPGSKEIDRLQRQVQLQKEIRDIIFQGELSRATGARQVLMLYERQRDMLKIVAEAAASASSTKPLEEAQGAVNSATEDAEKVRKSLQDNLKAAEAANNKGIFAKLGEGFEVMGTWQKPQSVTRLEEARAALEKFQKEGSPEVANAQAALLAAQEKGSQADKFDAAATRAEQAGRGDIATGLRLKSAELRVTGPEEAAKAAEDARQQIESLRRAGEVRKADLATSRAILGITSETAQAEDKIAAARRSGLERRRALTADVAGSQADKLEAAGQHEAATALRVQQKNYEEEFEQGIAELAKETAERARLRSREQATWQATIDAHAKNNEAVVAAARGNFAQADAAMKAAQQIEDNQAKVDRAFELKAQGFGQGDIDRIVGAEQGQREADRATRANAFRSTETRRAREMELENAARGIGGTDTIGSRRELIRMRDEDAFREQLSKNMEALGPGHASEAAKLALRTTSADILSQSQVIAGSGQVADSMAQLGLGGGVYAGVGGDPQLQAQKRIGDLTEETNRILVEVERKLNFGVK